MNISKRFNLYDLSGEVNTITKVVNEYTKSGNQLLDLTISNPTKANFTYPEAKIIDAFLSKEIFQYDPHPRGILPARLAIAEYYQELGFTISPDNIFITSGTSEAYAYLIKLLCNKGDAVLVPAPSYPLLDFLANLEDVKTIPYSITTTSSDTWTIDFSSLTKAINPKIKAILIVQPNNPTGNILSLTEIEQLLDIAGKYDIPLIIDEVFRDYLITNKKVYLLDSQKIPIFTLNGISKTLALPQFKLAWIISSVPRPIQREIFEALELISDTYLSVNTPIQTALPHILPLRRVIQTQIKQRLKENLSQIEEKIKNKKQLKLYTPEGGWYVILKFHHTKSDEDIAIQLIKEMGIFVHPGSMFRFPNDNFLVLSLLTPTEIFQEGVNRIISFF